MNSTECYIRDLGPQSDLAKRVGFEHQTERNIAVVLGERETSGYVFAALTPEQVALRANENPYLIRRLRSDIEKNLLARLVLSLSSDALSINEMTGQPESVAA